MATFKAIVDIALQECGYDNTAASSTPRTRMKRRVNEWHRRILRKPGYKSLLRNAFTPSFTAVSARAVYGLPMASGRILSMRETSNDRRLALMTRDELRTVDPGLTATGTPTHYVPRGWFPVKNQPTAAAGIRVDSSSAGDTQTIRVEYLDTNFVRRTASQTVNGITEAVVLASEDAVEITQAYLSSVAVGEVDLYFRIGSDNTTMVTFPAGSTSVKFFHVQLWPTPTATITYLLDVERELADMVQDTEEPLLPADFHDILWLGPVSNEWTLKDDARAAEVRADLEDALKSLNSYVWNLADYQPTPQPDYRPRSSRLGGWFPSGT